jgi:hypothetical protein
MHLTPDDIRGYIAATWNNPSCRRCGANAWDCGDGDNFNALLPIGSGTNTMIAQTRETLPLAWVVCNQCGSVDLIALKAIEVWKQSR